MKSGTWLWICISGILFFSVLGLVSYFSEITLISSLSRKYIPMAPLTASCFLFLAFALFLFNINNITHLKSALLYFTSAIILITNAILLTDFIFVGNLDIEDILFPVYTVGNGIPIFRISPATSFVFILAATDLDLFTSQKTLVHKRRFAEYLSGSLSLLILVVSYIFSLAYLYGKPILYSMQNMIPMAVSTSMSFLLYSVAILTLKRNYFPVKFLRLRSTHSILLRFILPLSIIPIVLIQISLLFSFKDVDKSSVIITTTISIIIALTVGVLATFISRYLGKMIDRQKTIIDDSEKAIKMGEEKYLNLFRTMAQGVVYQDSDGNIIEVNPAAEKLLGLTFEQMQGRTSVDPRWRTTDIDGNDLPGDRHPAMLALKSGTEVNNYIMGVYNPKIDKQVWIIVNSVPLFSGGMEMPWRVCTTFLDITDLKKLNDEKQRLKEEFEQQVIEKTKELNQQIGELEHFFQVTIERELRMEELRIEIELLKKQINNERNTQI